MCDSNYDSITLAKKEETLSTVKPLDQDYPNTHAVKHTEMIF